MQYQISFQQQLKTTKRKGLLNLNYGSYYGVFIRLIKLLFFTCILRYRKLIIGYQHQINQVIT